MSYLQKLRSPIFIIIIFVVAVFGSSLMGDLARVVSAGALGAITIALLVFKHKFWAGLAAIAIFGIFYFWIFVSLRPAAIAAGCHDGKIASNPKMSQTATEFLFRSGGAAAVVSTDEAEDFGWGDKLEVCFDVKQIQSAGSFKNYLLARYGTDFELKNPTIDLTAAGTGFVRNFYDWVDGLNERLSRIFIGNDAVLAKGLILGGSQGFSSEIKTKLKLTGTSHIVAVSGYNISIITVILFNAFRKAFSRRGAIIAVFLLLIIFVPMTGFTASVIRAAIMGLSYVFAKMLGRRGAVLNSLFVAALLMILLNPYVIYDLSFQLSFAATFGLVLVLGPLERIFKNELVVIMLSTLVAQLFTLPLSIANFGIVSIVAPLTNVLILPIVPVTMGLVSLALVGSYVSLSLGILIGGFAQILLRYIILIIKFFGGLHFAALSYKANWLVALMMYFVVGIVAVLLRRILARFSRKVF